MHADLGAAFKSQIQKRMHWYALKSGGGYFIVKTMSPSAESKKNILNVQAPKITPHQATILFETLKVRKPDIITKWLF